MRAKYICVDSGLCDCIVVFPEALKHADFSQNFRILSAGFIDMETFQCYGKSTSLDMKSRPEDTAIAQRQFKEREW